MNLFEFKGKTVGLDDFSKDVWRQTLKDSVAPVRDGARLLAEKMEEALSGSAGSAPGLPPGLVEGHLRNSIGYEEPETSVKHASVISDVGMGAGRAATLRVRESQAAGVNPFEYGWNLEHGGIGAFGRREPPRPFVRTTVAKHEAAVLRIFEEALE